MSNGRDIDDLGQIDPGDSVWHLKTYGFSHLRNSVSKLSERDKIELEGNLIHENEYDFRILDSYRANKALGELEIKDDSYEVWEEKPEYNFETSENYSRFNILIPRISDEYRDKKQNENRLLIQFDAKTEDVEEIREILR